MLIDSDSTPSFKSRVLQAHADCGGPASYRHQDLIAGELTPAAGGKYHRPGRAELQGGAVGALYFDGPIPREAAGTTDQLDAAAVKP